MMHTIDTGCGVWGFRNRPWREHPALAAGLGFRTLEFAIGGGHPGQMPEDPSSGDIARFRRVTAQAGVQTPFACIENDFTLDDPGRQRVMLSKVLRQMAAAAACGAMFVRLFTGFRPYVEMDESAWRQLLDALSACEVRANELGLAVAIETHGALTFCDGATHHVHTASTHPEGLARLLREMPARIGINYDPGNLKAVAPEDRTYALPAINARVNYCHLKDWRRAGEGWAACAIGDDDLDYQALLPMMDYRGVYLIEYEPLEDTFDGIRRSLGYLKRTGFQPALV